MKQGCVLEVRTKILLQADLCSSSCFPEGMGLEKSNFIRGFCLVLLLLLNPLILINFVEALAQLNSYLFW